MNSIESVPDLRKLMYIVADGYPCVRLLNLSGEIGCSSKILFRLYLSCQLQRLGNFLDEYSCGWLFTLPYLSSDPGRDKVVAPIIRFKDAKELAQSSTILVSEDEIQAFFSRHVDIFISKTCIFLVFSLLLQVKNNPFFQNAGNYSTKHAYVHYHTPEVMQHCIKLSFSPLLLLPKKKKWKEFNTTGFEQDDLMCSRGYML